MPARLLETKFHVPARRIGGVSRPRLLEQLQQGWADQRKLTLLSAPAGYGKTTLVAEWLAALTARASSSGGADGVSASWLSLDQADNEPGRFLRYFVGAFQRADRSLGAQVNRLLDMPSLPPVDTLLDPLLNDLAAGRVPVRVVLDDYHVISRPEVHAALAYFLDHKPASTHLVLTTRADPPLPLARWRVQRQLTELRARDLRFTADEARALFGQANLLLAENALRALDERTEGWAAGLQLAALALQHQSDPATFIETFRGSHRYVLDYLAGEVLQQQGEEIRAFLTQTGPLDRFNADLCQALTGREDSQALIAHLERSNLFVVPLDGERHWFRYHHLFADYLRSLLSKTERAALYRKAAAWHEAHDLAPEAVRYAVLSNDPEYTAEVVEHALSKDATWSEGNLAQLTAWLGALPPAAIQSRPRLGLQAARVHFVQGRFAQAEAHLAQAERSLQAQPTVPDRDDLLAMVDLNRGAMAAVRGEYRQALALIPAARARIPRENHTAHARALLNLGVAHEAAGQTAQAAESYLRSSAEARAAGVLFLEMHALCVAAQLQISQGGLRRAAETCQEAVQLAGGARLPPLGLAWSVLGLIALERNDLPAAEKHLRDGMAVSRQGGLREDLLVGLAALGRLRACQGDLAGVQAAIEEGLAIIRSVDIAWAETLMQAHLARSLHILGRHEAAARWARDYQAVRAEPLREFEELTLARIWLASGAVESLGDILHPILEKAEAAGRTRSSLEAMILLGLYQHARQETGTALVWLSKALALAAPEGILRPFLDEGQPLRVLLPLVRQASPALVDTLLGQTPAAPGSGLATLDQLPEPLSDQELRVLRLVVAGKSNPEIAQALVISVGTAKWHVHNILQKLEVSTRPQAIARARELGM
jgi:LuxR family maltose regulon positive regulatory protein